MTHNIRLKHNMTQHTMPSSSSFRIFISTWWQDRIRFTMLKLTSEINIAYVNVQHTKYDIRVMSQHNFTKHIVTKHSTTRHDTSNMHSQYDIADLKDRMGFISSTTFHLLMRHCAVNQSVVQWRSWGDVNPSQPTFIRSFDPKGEYIWQWNRAWRDV